MEPGRLGVAAAGALAIAASVTVNWATVRFGDLDVLPTTVRGTDLWQAWVLVASAALAVLALAIGAMSRRDETRNRARIAAGVVGIIALVAVGTVLLRTGPIAEAATETAADRIATGSGLPAERLTTLLEERVSGAADVAFGAGPLVAGAGGLLLVGATVFAPRRHRGVTEPGTEVHANP